MNREEFLLKLQIINELYVMPQHPANMQPIHNACVEYNKLLYEQQNFIDKLKFVLQVILKVNIDELDLEKLYETAVDLQKEQMEGR